MAIPTTFQTQRLIIRAITIEDAAFFLKLINTPLWIQFIGDRNVKTVVEAETYIREKVLPQLDKLGYTNNIVIRKNDHTKLGSCGIYHREGNDIPDIGFAFLPEFHGQGYAFEAANALMRAAHQYYQLKELSAYTMEENTASRGLLERLGFTSKGYGKIPVSDDELLHYHRILNF